MIKQSRKSSNSILNGMFNLIISENTIKKSKNFKKGEKIEIKRSNETKKKDKKFNDSYKKQQKKTGLTIIKNKNKK
jgi:hypothetical protein|tara:strand:- start:997 stop:1224 length:228 start_codon:yes stop_codon:yes gene_type:complete